MMRTSLRRFLRVLFNSLRDVRNNLYHSVKKLLTKQGVFVEEIPFSEGIGNYTLRFHAIAQPPSGAVSSICTPNPLLLETE